MLRILVWVLLFWCRNLKWYIFLKLLFSHVMGWIVSPKKICWSPNLHYLGMWPRLEIGSLRWVQLGLCVGRWAPSWIWCQHERMPVGAGGPEGRRGTDTRGRRPWGRRGLSTCQGRPRVAGEGQKCRGKQAAPPEPPARAGPSGHLALGLRASILSKFWNVVFSYFFQFKIFSLFSLVISLTHGFLEVYRLIS